MSFGDFLKMAREEAKISQRNLAELSGVSHTEISKIESGVRQNPSPHTLKAISPFIGVSYEELMVKAGYLEEVIDHKGYTEKIYRDESGKVVDIQKRIKEMYEKSSEWANLAYRVTAADLSDEEIEDIKAQTEFLLERYLQKKNKK